MSNEDLPLDLLRRWLKTSAIPNSLGSLTDLSAGVVVVTEDSVCLLSTSALRLAATSIGQSDVGDRHSLMSPVCVFKFA